MEERGHLGRKYEDESSVPNPDLWNRIESGIQRKKPRRGILWWWGLGGAMFLLAGWWTVRPNTNSVGVAQHETISRPSEKLARKPTPSPKEELSKGHSSSQLLPDMAKTNSDNIQNQVAKAVQELPLLPEQTDHKTPVIKSTFLARASSPQIVKKNKKRNTEIAAGKPLFAVEGKHNQSSAFLDEKEGGEVSLINRESAAKQNEESPLSASVPLAAGTVIEGPGKVNGGDIPEISTGKDVATVESETVVSTPDLTSEAERKASQVDEPRANASKPHVPLNSSDSSKDEEAYPEAESTEIKPDTLTKLAHVTFPDTVATDSSKLDSTRLDLPRTWRLGVSGAAFYTSKYSQLNEDPEQSRVALATRNSLSTDRFAWSVSFWIQKQLSRRLSWFASIGLLLIQDQSDFTVRRDSVTGYSERTDANGNHFIRPVYDQYEVSVLSRNLYLESQAGVLFPHLAGPIGLKIGAGVNLLIWEDRKTVTTQKRALGNAGKNAGWVPSLNIGVPIGIRVNAKSQLLIEPSVNYFFSPVFKPGKGTDNQPMLLGAKFGISW